MFDCDLSTGLALTQVISESLNCNRKCEQISKMLHGEPEHKYVHYPDMKMQFSGLFIKTQVCTWGPVCLSLAQDDFSFKDTKLRVLTFNMTTDNVTEVSCDLCAQFFKHLVS